MHDPAFCEFSTQQAGYSTNFNYKYLHCFVRWVGPNYLLPFQVCVDMFILGCRVELLRFVPPFWVRPNSGSKFPDYIWALPGTYLFYPSFPLNEHAQQTVQSVQNSLVLHFTPQYLKLQDHRSGVYSPRYFHTTHSVNNYLQQIHSFFQMLWSSVALCYDKIIEDLTLLHLFSPEEYSSTQELPCLGAIQFRLISEGLFAYIASPDKCRKTGVEFVTLTSLKKSGGTTNTAILITESIGGRDLNMVTVFCHPEQARIEACDAILVLCQCDSSEPSVWW